MNQAQKSGLNSQLGHRFPLWPSENHLAASAVWAVLRKHPSLLFPPLFCLLILGAFQGMFRDHQFWEAALRFLLRTPQRAAFLRGMWSWCVRDVMDRLDRETGSSMCPRPLLHYLQLLQYTNTKIVLPPAAPTRGSLIASNCACEKWAVCRKGEHPTRHGECKNQRNNFGVNLKDQPILIYFCIPPPSPPPVTCNSSSTFPKH